MGFFRSRVVLPCVWVAVFRARGALWCGVVGRRGSGSGGGAPGLLAIFRHGGSWGSVGC